jgi:hypothetical protein
MRCRKLGDTQRVNKGKIRNAKNRPERKGAKRDHLPK